MREVGFDVFNGAVEFFDVVHNVFNFKGPFADAEDEVGHVVLFAAVFDEFCLKMVVDDVDIENDFVELFLQDVVI